MRLLVLTCLFLFLLPQASFGATKEFVSVLPVKTQQIYTQYQNTPKPLQQGDSGAKVHRAQDYLVRLGYLAKGQNDGAFGNRTYQAVLAFQAWEGIDIDGVIGPKTWQKLPIATRPKIKEKNGVVINLNKQLLFLQKNGHTLRVIHVSSGKPGYSTPKGTYSVYRKERHGISEKYDNAPMPYAVYFIGGYAIHESASVPNYPASHGCVRVTSGEGSVIWDIARRGAVVKVV